MGDLIGSLIELGIAQLLAAVNGSDGRRCAPNLALEQCVHRRINFKVDCTAFEFDEDAGALVRRQDAHIDRHRLIGADLAHRPLLQHP